MRVLFGLLTLLLIAACLLARSYSEANESLSRVIHQIEVSGGIGAALPELTEAVRWRSPWNRASDRAAAVLQQCIADEQCPKRLEAVRALKQGIAASRSLLTYRSDLRLLASLRELEDQLIGGERQVRELHPPEWRPWVQLWAQLCLWGWIGIVMLLIFRGCRADGTFIAQSAARYAVFASLFFCGWLLFLSRA